MVERRIIQMVLQHRKLILGLTVLLTALALYQGKDLEYDNSIEAWFLEDDPDILTYNAFLERFEADQLTVVAVFAEDVFDTELLSMVEKMTQEFESAPHVHRVISLSNISVAQGTGAEVHIGPLMDNAPETQSEAEKLGRRVLDDPLLVPNLVSANSKATAILVELDGESNDFIAKSAHINALREISSRLKLPSTKIRIAGAPAVDEIFYRLSYHDSVLFGPLILLVVLISTLVVFRRWTAILVPLAVVLLAQCWTFGVMVSLGIKFTVVSGALLTVILAIGVADSIHVLAEFFQHTRGGLSREEAAVESTSELLVPCFFTSITTIAGMLALLSSDLGPIREFGIMAAFGVGTAFFLSMTIGPILLLLVRAPNAIEEWESSGDLISRALSAVAEISINRSKTVLVVSLVMLASSFYGLQHLKLGANALRYFHETSSIRQDTAAIDQTLGGTTTLELMIDAPNGGLKNPDVLERLDALANWLSMSPYVGEIVSPVNGLKELHRVLEEKPRGEETLPESEAMAAQLYLLMEGDDSFDTTVQDDYSISRMSVRVRMSDAHEFTNEIPAIQKKLAEGYQREDLKVHLTGFIKLMGEMEAYLIQSQVRSFLIAFVVVTLMLGFLLRAGKLALFSMIPNFTPIIVGLGLMPSLNIPLDPGTVMIGSIALGLVVDDTVHFLVRFRRKLSEGRVIESAIHETIVDAGRPITVTSFVLALSFLILLLGSFNPNINFGLVSAIIIILALIADLLVLPAAMKFFRPQFKTQT